MDLENEIKKLKTKNELMKILSTDLGFFISYYQINLINNDKDFSFNNINEIYKDLFGSYKFTDINDFFINGFKFINN